MQIRFCPGYYIARQCNRHCADCAHIIIRDVADEFASLIPVSAPGDLAPVLGHGRVERLKIVRTSQDTEKILSKRRVILPTGKKAQRQSEEGGFCHESIDRV